MQKRVAANTRKTDAALEIALIVLALMWLFPVYYLVVMSLKTPQEAAFNPLSIPRVWAWNNYAVAWESMRYPIAFKDTLIIVASSVSVVVLISSMAAYTFSRRPTRVNNTLFIVLMAGIMVPFQMSIMALFKIIVRLGLMDTLMSVIVVDVFINVPASVFLFRNFMTTIPVSVEEAARIDGATVYQTFWLVVFPLLKPVVATVTIVDALTIWNDFLTPQLFLSSRDNSVILLEVARNVGQFSVDWTSAFPMLVLGIAPMLIFYLFMQKYIIKGTVTGSVKG